MLVVRDDDRARCEASGRRWSWRLKSERRLELRCYPLPRNGRAATWGSGERFGTYAELQLGLNYARHPVRQADTTTTTECLRRHGWYVAVSISL